MNNLDQQPITLSQPGQSQSIRFTISVSNDENTIYDLQINSDDFKQAAIGVLRNSYLRNKKNNLQVIAIDNLLKIRNSLQLNLDLSDGVIDEEEFNKELEEKPERYIVDVTSNFVHDDILLIGEIISQLKTDHRMSSDDVSSVFGIDHDHLLRLSV